MRASQALRGWRRSLPRPALESWYRGRPRSSPQKPSAGLSPTPGSGGGRVSLLHGSGLYLSILRNRHRELCNPAMGYATKSGGLPENGVSPTTVFRCLNLSGYPPEKSTYFSRPSKINHRKIPHISRGPLPAGIVQGSLAWLDRPD